MENIELFVLEYSVIQKAYHVQGLNEMIKRNLRNCMCGISTDFIVIGVFKTREEANEYINTIRTEIGIE